MKIARILAVALALAAWPASADDTEMSEFMIGAAVAAQITCQTKLDQDVAQAFIRDTVAKGGTIAPETAIAVALWAAEQATGATAEILLPDDGQMAERKEHLCADRALEFGEHGTWIPGVLRFP